MSTAQFDEPSNPRFDPVVLVSGGTSSYRDEAWLRTLQDSIAAATGGIVPSIESIDSIDATGKACVFLGEMHQPLLQMPSSAVFDRKTLARGTSQWTWTRRGLFWARTTLPSSPESSRQPSTILSPT